MPSTQILVIRPKKDKVIPKVSFRSTISNSYTTTNQTQSKRSVHLEDTPQRY